MQTRRGLMAGAVGTWLAGVAAARKPAIRIGVTDWNLKQTAKPEAVEMAQRLGFDGVQVSLGKVPVNGKLALDDGPVQAAYVAKAKEAGIKIDGTCLDILHVNYLKNDKQGQKWVQDGIRATRALKTQVMLLPFFGPGALETKDEMNYVADVLRELGPEAEKADVVLGVEDTISADDNLGILERARSKAVKVYYDTGNSTAGGFDVIREIRRLGPERICQFHFKDEPGYLGEGKVDFPMVIHTILTSGYSGFANLETSAPSRSVEADLRRNLSYIRRLTEQNP